MRKPRQFLPDDRLRQIAEDYLRARWGELAGRAVDTFAELPFVQRHIVRRWEWLRKLPAWAFPREHLTEKYRVTQLREHMYQIMGALEDLRNSRYQLPVEVFQRDVALLQERFDRAKSYGSEPVSEYCESQLREAQQILTLLEQNLTEMP